MFNETKLFLQLFADGGAGAAGGDGGAAVGAGEATGVTAPDAGVRRLETQRVSKSPMATADGQIRDLSAAPRAKRGKENPLANVKYGKQPETEGEDKNSPAPGRDATGDGQAADKRDEGDAKPSFKELIEGEYKAEFGEYVQNVIRQRFKANAENEEKLGKVTPILEMLGKKYNIDPTDVDQIAKVVGDDDSLYEAEAIERGMSIESLKAVKQMERENARLKQREQQSIAEQRMKAHFDVLARQADEAKKLYPSLDLGAEMQNPTFVRLTSPGVGVDVRTAYEVVHRDEMRGAEMQYAAQKSAERMANAIRSGSMRPVENGLQGQQNAGTVKADPRSLTKADRAEIKRRVQKGEKIVF